MKHSIGLLALSLFPSLALAQRSDIPRDQLYFVDRAGGAPQVRGRTYKAEFGPEGATYIPNCGPKAAQNHPLTFRLQAITAGAERVRFSDSAEARRDGSVVRYARGGVSEVYALDVDSIEQKFVFESLPASGELVVRMDCETGMSASKEGDAIVFASAEGSVRYGAATALDAHGAATPAQTQLVEGGLEIRVPAEFLARASFPVTIDPVISTFDIAWGGTTYDDFAPAIAWDETNQRFCTVFEEAYSGTDHDVVYVYSDPAGAFLYAGFIDVSANYWANPDVANNDNVDKFCIVAEVGDPAAGARTIHGITLEAWAAVLGPDVVISAGDTGDQVNPSVGGDPYLGPAYFTTVWQRIDIPGSDEDIHARLMDTNGILAGAGPILIENSNGTLDRRPRISKSCRYTGIHHVVWERQLAGLWCDVYGAQLSWDGIIQIGSTPLITGGVTTHAACSSIDNWNNWVLVCQSGVGFDRDIYGLHLSGLTTNDPFSLTNQEHLLGANNLTQDQVHPAVETDGIHFAIAYSELQGFSGNYNTYVSTVDWIGGTVRVGEFHQALGSAGTPEDFPRMCSPATLGGSSDRIGIAWYDDENLPDFRDVEGAVYVTGKFVKLCTPSTEGVIGCPCGNPPTAMGRGCNNSSNTGGASISATGWPSVGLDTLQLVTTGQKPTSASIVTQGTAFITAGAGFGQGVRCTGGSLKRLYVKTAVGGSITVPGPSDLLITTRSAAAGDPLAAGSFRYYFVYYRDPTVLGGCPVTAGFNATDTLQVVWGP